jgi:hypothetical protein
MAMIGIGDRLPRFAVESQREQLGTHSPADPALG